jgi:anti-sigma-K factor RskA
MNAHLVLNNRPAFWLNLSKNLNFWRALGMTSTALAILLIVLLIAKQPAQAVTTIDYVATLSDDDWHPVVVISGDVIHHRLIVKVLTWPSIATDNSMELWAVQKTGNPRSLGLITRDDIVTLRLPGNATPESVALLAVSLEPPGGSPNPNGPTGPILFKGAWVSI